MSWKKKLRRMNHAASTYQAQPVRGQYQVAFTPGIGSLAPTSEATLIHAPPFPSTYMTAESGIVVNTYALYLDYQAKTITKPPVDVGSLAFNKLYGPTLIAAGIVGGKIPSESQAAGGWDGDWAPWVEAWGRMVNIAETYAETLESQGWSITEPQQVSILLPALAQAGSIPPQRDPYGAVIVSGCTPSGWCY